MSESNTNVLTETGPDPISLSAPAVNTGGRDSTALRVSGVPGSSSALDLIKKKLQDSGAPATSSPIPTLSGPVALESNASRAFDTTVKGPQNEKIKDKLKDANGDGNMSDSSSDSEDVVSGPTKEECIIQFKVSIKKHDLLMGRGLSDLFIMSYKVADLNYATFEKTSLFGYLHFYHARYFYLNVIVQ